MQLSSKAQSDIISDGEFVRHHRQSAHGIVHASLQHGWEWKHSVNAKKWTWSKGQGAHNTTNMGECNKNNHGCHGRCGRRRG